MEIITKSAKETKKLGKKIAIDLENYKDSQAIILALSGELGSGKTTFVQGLAEGLMIEKRIISPTFILLRRYECTKSNNISFFYHIDLYRLEGNIENELIHIGVSDIWEKQSNFVVIEWAEKAKKAIPGTAIWIEFENLGGNKRRISSEKL